jgi:hypothetical protein
MTSIKPRLRYSAYPIAILMLASVAPSPARAEFFNDVRRTFETDIPHFFQDDIPCAFGGEPTSHTKTSCKSGQRPTQPFTGKEQPSAPADASTYRY